MWRKFEVIRRNFVWSEHLFAIGELLVHPERVFVSPTNVIDWELAPCFDVYWEAIGLVVKMQGDWGTMDVVWLPTEYHVWPKRVLTAYAGQLHWRHSCEDLASHEGVVLILVGLLARRAFLLDRRSFFLALRRENAIGFA